MSALTVDEARARAAALTVHSYELEFDLTQGDRTFTATSTIRFAASEADSFVEVRPDELLRVSLNGQPVDVSTLDDGRLPLTGLEAENELVVEARMLYAFDGEGLQRSVDAADGKVYLYATSFLDAAPRYFACFDQPDLKATYRLKLTCPEEWVVLGNGPATRTAPGQWEIVQPKPISTYLVTLVAGPYHLIRSEHDGIPLGLACRASLGPDLDKDADELFTVTRQAFEEYHRLFHQRYPFGEYWQVFVPDFIDGAMENVGCVTFSDNMVYRSKVTDAERGLRARVVAHEMAHMWFGDLVTMRWWNDLWLNESFAEYMGHRIPEEVTDFAGQWDDFGFNRKWWGLRADQRSSTHPVAADAVKNAQESLDDFDGISYAKGAAVLRQLTAYVGEEVFFAGVNAHFEAGQFGNADFGEFVGKLTDAGAVDLPNWSEQWLRTAGLDTISVERSADGVVVRRHTPADHPANRPHQLTIGSYDEAGHGTFTKVLLDQAEVVVPLEPGLVVVPDALDDTWAKIRLDATSLANLPLVLPKLAAGVTRSVIWNSIRDATNNAELDPRQAFTILLEALPHEDSDIAIGSLLRWLDERLLGVHLPYEPYRGQAAAVLTARLGSVAPGSSLQLAVARGVIATTDDGELLQNWLAGEAAPDGLEIDTDLRWTIVVRLAQLDVIGTDEIGAELDRDRSTGGTNHANRARAALLSGKEAAWTRLMTDPELGLDELMSICATFWHPSQSDAMAPYVDRYFAEIAATGSVRTGSALMLTALLGYPRFAIDERVADQAREILGTSLAPAIQRAISDRLDDLGQALKSRAL
jgi:aminopeptidase N